MLNYILMGIGLSIDAFSLSLSLCSSNLLTKNKKVFFILLIGLSHFLMPLFGNMFYSLININLESISRYILIGIFIFLIIELLSKKEDKINRISYLIIFFMSISVSIDSFTIGICLSANNTFKGYIGIIFAFISMLFTTTGLFLGNYINKKFESKAKYVGIVIMLILIVKYVFNL